MAEARRTFRGWMRVVVVLNRLATDAIGADRTPVFPWFSVFGRVCDIGNDF